MELENLRNQNQKLYQIGSTAEQIWQMIIQLCLWIGVALVIIIFGGHEAILKMVLPMLSVAAAVGLTSFSVSLITRWFYDRNNDLIADLDVKPELKCRSGLDG